jgi:hypothetical protein
MKLAGRGVGFAVVLMLKLVVAVFATIPLQTPEVDPPAPGIVGFIAVIGVPNGVAPVSLTV